ncbi:Ornithine cyclodeaminase/mu-crystallin family protein [Trichophyton interdigitale]|uniref:Ornithine cyclodeaminase/mu-crystallin family protein n=1 Tax=Trichophyton interdigitale TaxID=101480 RepID=A0A9P5CY69_9EURO|nr:Ornithine cyclodeaminase/mu-crystallin family protein [Trichophyton interdigitale]KAF3896892.1 Ornithine cyclodeaminase/mu-crystallin family protein [Trichophyton interdigitale]KAG8209918.1 Ornithine cyclodeaminase/mu-crystallin family protein [Trichophyton interdigitale]
MGDTLRTFLCQGWRRDSFSNYNIHFKQDGTGSLFGVSDSDMHAGIYAVIEWEATDPSVLKQIVGAKPYGDNTQLLSEFELKITIKKRASREGLGKAYVHAGRLKEEAFLPKKYMVRLEKGKFTPPQDKDPDGRVMWRSMSPYNYHLVFDKSPYPPREHWKDGTVWDAVMGAQECKEFHGGSVKRK